MSALAYVDLSDLSIGEHIIDGVELHIGRDGHVLWRSDCGACAANGKDGFAPRHDASPSCESGGHQHCSCARCF